MASLYGKPSWTKLSGIGRVKNQAWIDKMLHCAWHFTCSCLMFICPCLIFYLSVLDIFICSCLMFIYHVLDIFICSCLMFICTCLMFYLYVLDVYLYVLDGFICTCLMVLSDHAWHFYPSVLYVFIHLCLIFLSVCAWCFCPTVFDLIQLYSIILSLSKISFFVSTGLIFCRSHVFKFNVVLKNFF